MAIKTAEEVSKELVSEIRFDLTEIQKQLLGLLFITAFLEGEKAQIQTLVKP